MLTVSNVSKIFPGVKALSGVQLEVKAGEIHALVDEDGAGKSTLTKIIGGVFRPDEGQIEFDGEIIHWNSPADAKAAGIHVIYQEFVLFANLTVAENIFLGHERRLHGGPRIERTFSTQGTCRRRSASHTQGAKHLRQRPCQ